MGRVTRKKAAEIAEQLHVDEDAVLDMDADDAALKAKLATPEHGGRSPLGEIAPNSAEGKAGEDQEPVEELKKSTRGRKAGKKGAAKGKKNNLAASTATPSDDADAVPDDNESAPSPASENAADDLVSSQSALPSANVEMQPDRSQSPPSAAVRLTRSQIAKRCEAEEETESLVHGLGQAQEGQGGYFVSEDNPVIETSGPTDMSETAMMSVMDAPASPLPTAVPNVVKNLRSDTPAKRSTSNKENVQPESDANSMASPRVHSSAYDALEDAVVVAATPPRSTPQETPALEAGPSPLPTDPIVALDDLEDAVENVSRDIPEVQTSPEKPQARKEEHTPPTSPKVAGQEPPKKGPSNETKAEARTQSKKPVPVVRTTKAAQARLSMALNKDLAGKTSTLGRPSTTLARSTSVRQSIAPKPEAASKRITSNPTSSRPSHALKTSTTAAPPREKKEAVIPHSKPRPISLSFPTPPPPPKSTRPTTQSSFQLPGEAVAAKLKAAREARLAREAAKEAEEKKTAFKARPAPKMGAQVAGVRPTNASRARESVVAGKPAPAPAGAGHKRASTVAHIERPRVASKEKASSSTSTAPTSATAPARPRPSTTLAHVSKARASTVTSAPRVVSGGTGTGTAKGKAVFARAADAQAAAAREKAEKEGAAKRARAEAAERGRVASREWAARQKAKKMGGGKGVERSEGDGKAVGAAVAGLEPREAVKGTMAELVAIDV